MKRFAISFFSMLLSWSFVHGQKTLLSDTPKELGFFVAPSIQGTSIDGAGAVIGTLRAGVTLQSKWSVGGFYQGSFGDIYPTSETSRTNYLDFRSAGGFVELTTKPTRLVHLTFPLLIGMGELEFDNDFGQAGLGEANFVHIEPQVQVQVNVHKFVKGFAGVGYRWVSPLTYRSLTAQEVSGLTGQIGLKVGLFK